MSGNTKAEEEKYKKYIKGLFICLKRDGFTRLRTNYFRVNIRFKNANNKPCTRTKILNHRMQVNSFINLLKIL